MTTFERYFIEDKASHKEVKNPYYYLREGYAFEKPPSITNILPSALIGSSPSISFTGVCPLKNVSY
jgi:fructose-1,6-bisphosphatase